MMTPATGVDEEDDRKIRFRNRSEFELLRRLTMKRVGSAAAAEILRAAPAGTDWECFLEDARYHRLRSLVWDKLRDAPKSAVLPGGVAAALNEEFEANARRTRDLADELVKILKALEANGVPALPFKGPALGYAAFPEAAERDTANLDVIVGPRALPKSREALLARGYRFKPFSKVMNEETQWHIEGNVRFYNRDSDTEICVHAQIVPRRYGHHTSFSRMWERSRPLELPGGKVAYTGPEDCLLILCLHAIKNGFWPTLKLVCDLSQVIGSEKVDWRLLMSEAHRVHCGRIVLLGLTLANKILETPLPPEVLAQIDCDGAVPGIRDWIMGRLPERESGFVHLIDASRMHANLRRNAVEKARYFFHVVATPSERDFERKGRPVSVPQAYALRFAAMAKKCAAQVASKVAPRRRRTA